MPEGKSVQSLKRIIDGDGETHTSRKKHRSKFILVFGVVLTFLLALASICIGQTSILSPIDALSSLFSAIGKGGTGLEGNEILVYEDRLPRTLMTIGVGIGLSIAGATYQALIRNPLVDPYIMGVSSGAGTFAIAVIGFNFTFFGLISIHSEYLTAIAAIFGGLLAFAATMLLARAAGRTTNGYLLSGVIIGLLFSAVQTAMIKFMGHKVSNSMAWLFGSFSNATLTQSLIVIVAAAILVTLLMRKAKELNLVLLGENEARQMGLDVKKFTTVMLILASVLASFCVAFCGIIGFVGLVVPHLCRMIFGGDHRLVMPASIAFGGAMMILADLVARMALHSQELPVGAITTLIGVPVFAYLLIKRGKIYNG